MTDATPPVHLRLRGSCDEGAERRVLRAVLDATHLLGLATGTHLRRLRELNDPLAALQARLQEAELRARLAWETAELLGSRFAKIPERHRPYFTPAQRFRILEIRNLLAWNAHETARVFLVCSNTILNWEKAADPSAKIVGVTIQPTPPVRRAADVVRSLVQTMTRLGMGGQDLCSRILARAGWSVSARSIGRYRKERCVPPPTQNNMPARPLLFYLCFRPHEGLNGATPAEAFLGLEPAHLAAVEPPRATPGEGPQQAPFQVDYLDPATRAFPILKPAA